MIYEVSVDDAGVLDTHIADLLESYGLRGTFYIPVMQSDLSDQQIIGLSKKHEIGSHTMSHPSDMKMLDRDALIYEVQASKTKLEQLVGHEIVKFCYPRGRFNEEVKRVVMEAGYGHARTTRVGATELPKDAYEVDTTLHIFPRREYKGLTIMEYAKEKFRQASDKELGYFHVWMHSKEINELGYWSVLDEILQMIASVL